MYEQDLPYPPTHRSLQRINNETKRVAPKNIMTKETTNNDKTKKNNLGSSGNQNQQQQEQVDDIVHVAVARTTAAVVDCTQPELHHDEIPSSSSFSSSVDVAATAASTARMTQPQLPTSLLSKKASTSSVLSASSEKSCNNKNDPNVKLSPSSSPKGTKGDDHHNDDMKVASSALKNSLSNDKQMAGTSLASLTSALSLSGGGGDDNNINNMLADEDGDINGNVRESGGRPGAIAVCGVSAATTTTDHTTPPSETPTTDHVVEAQVVNDDTIREEIAAQVRNELLQQTVQASIVEVNDSNNHNDDTDTDKPGSKSSEQQLLLQKQKATMRKRVSFLAMVMVAILIVGVVLGVVLSNRRNGRKNNSNTNTINSNGNDGLTTPPLATPPRTTPPSQAPSVTPSQSPSQSPSTTPTQSPTAAICPFCYLGLPSVLLATTTNLTLESFFVSRTNQTCANLYDQSQQLLLYSDISACRRVQADAWLYCGCPLVPARRIPKRRSNCTTTCAAANNNNNNGRSSLLCQQYGTYATIVGQTSKAACNVTKQAIIEQNCSCS